MKQIAWAIVKPFIRTWLANRALILPAAKRAEAARRLNLTQDQIGEVNALIIAQALEQLELFKP